MNLQLTGDLTNSGIQGGSTDLKGSVIASNQSAVDEGKNSFSTGGTLTTTDIQNTASYSASSASVGVGVGQVGKDLGVSGVGAGVGRDSGSASSTTTAGISGIAGDTAVRSTDAETGIARIFEKERVQAEIDAQTKITETFGREASKAVGDYAASRVQEANALRAKANGEPDADKRAELNAEADSIIAQWGDNGTLRLLAHTVIGGLTGGSAGAAGAAIGTLSAPAIAQALKEAGIDGPLASTLTGIGSTLIGAAAGGTAGGAAAFNEVANNYLNHAEARRLSDLKDKKLLGQCNSACEAEIKSLEQLDQQRNNAFHACEGQTTDACAVVFKEVRQAAADYIRANVRVPSTNLIYEDERGETLALAQQTMGDYTVWNIGKGAATSLWDGLKAAGSALYLGYEALLGDPAAKDKLQAGLGAAWDFVSDPENWPQLVGALSPAQREELARAYERGDGEKVASVLGEQLANLPIGGGAGTVKRVIKVGETAEEIAQLAKRLDVERVVDVPAGSKGNWDPEINTGKTGNLMPNTAYRLDNRHTYVTDASGRVTQVEADLSLTTKDRNNYQQACSGQSGCAGDDGGHLVASSLGGTGDRINLVPQSQLLNRSEWRAMEQDLASYLREGKSVSVKIDVGYSNSNGSRPNIFKVTALVNGSRQEFNFIQ